MTDQVPPPELPNRWVKVTHHSPAHIAERYPMASYGSNLWIAQVARRCPEADIVGAGHIPDCQLFFAYYAGIKEQAGATTPVAVYRLNARDVAAMDRQEGLGRSYERYLVTVTMADGTRLRCFTYVKRDMTPEAPSTIYYNRCADGYRDWHFDLDILRAARAQALRSERRHRPGTTGNTTSTGWSGRMWTGDRWEPVGANTWDAWKRDKAERRAAAKRSRDASGKFISSLVTGREIRDPGPACHDEMQPTLPIEYLTDPERAARLVDGQTSFTNPRNGERWSKGHDGIWRRTIES